MASAPLSVMSPIWEDEAQQCEDDLSWEIYAMAAQHNDMNKAPDVDDFMRYEDGRMSQAEEIIFFQRLVNSDMAWQLQGSYGRAATDYINSGLVTRPSASA